MKTTPTHTETRVDAVLPSDILDAQAVTAGPLLKLHLDPTLLAEYESPSFDETSAVPMDALLQLVVEETASLDARAPSPPRATASGTRSESGAAASATAGESSVGWMLSTLRSPSPEMRCRYGKGKKCKNPRTLKRNGSLHSYCEFHRLRTVKNQRRFDRKKRGEMATHVCRACRGDGRGVEDASGHRDTDDCRHAEVESDTEMKMEIAPMPRPGWNEDAEPLPLEFCGPLDDARASTVKTPGEASPVANAVKSEAMAWV